MLKPNDIWTFVKYRIILQHRASYLRSRFCAVSLLLSFVIAGVGQIPDRSGSTSARQTPPKTWLDPDTDHRVTRISDEPDSKALYFDVNAYTPDGLDMIYTTKAAIHALNFATMKSRIIYAGVVTDIVVGVKTRRVFFQKPLDPHVYVVDVDTKHWMQLAQLPAGGSISSVNADETLLVGTFVEGAAAGFSYYETEALHEAHAALADSYAAAGSDPDATAKVEEEARRKAHTKGIEARFAAHLAEDMFTFNLATGASNVIMKGTDWLNHVQFSPTDPTLILYDHEGPPLKLDRIWTVRADGTDNRLIHKRIGGKRDLDTHEFWSHDGKTIWFEQAIDHGDHNPIDRSLTGVDAVTGKTIKMLHYWYNQASLHFYPNEHDTKFCGDGFEYKSAHPEVDRQWIEINYVGSLDGKEIGMPFTGMLRTTRLVHLAKDNYFENEPNARFSPDHNFVIFTSNMFGPTYIFAVDLKKGDKPSAPKPN